jgi:hypothetical protein
MAVAHYPQKQYKTVDVGKMAARTAVLTLIALAVILGAVLISAVA